MIQQKLTSFYAGLSTRRTIRKNVLAQHLASYFTNAKYRLGLFRSTKANTDALIASDFSTFEFFPIDENTLSDIFSDLLDTHGKHGQQTLFLSKFIEVTKLSQMFLASDCRSVCREDPTTYIAKSARRIDLTIHFGSSGIGIENKPWAREQTNQLRDYDAHLRKRYGNKYSLIYLTGNEDSPIGIGRDHPNLKIITYNDHVINWLNQCYKECKADKVRWFLSDFIGYIEQTFTRFSEDLTYDQ